MIITGILTNWDSPNCSTSLECSKCKRRLDGDEIFCPKCGRKLNIKPTLVPKKAVLKAVNAIKFQEGKEAKK